MNAAVVPFVEAVHPEIPIAESLARDSLAVAAAEVDAAIVRLSYAADVVDFQTGRFTIEIRLEQPLPRILVDADARVSAVERSAGRIGFRIRSIRPPEEMRGRSLDAKHRRA